MAPLEIFSTFLLVIFMQVYLGNAQNFIQSRAAYYPNSEEKGTESKNIFVKMNFRWS